MSLDLAAGHAWLERHKRRPFHDSHWSWNSESAFGIPIPSQLPAVVFRRLSDVRCWDDQRFYLTEEVALADAARAVAEALAAGELED